MLGQASSGTTRGVRRWVRRLWGHGDIHTRQKWMAIWPTLAAMPLEGLRVLDAGCGDGQWALELACRRPSWTIVGLDRDADRIAEAEAARARLGCSSVSFVTADFLHYEPAVPFDLILSVASAHYLAQAGLGNDLFARLRAWSVPGGALVMYVPRARHQAWFTAWLKRPEWHSVFTADELSGLCRQHGFRVASLMGHIGMFGTVAKQLAWSTRHHLALYPLELFLTALDRRSTRLPRDQSLMLLLEARADE